MKTIGGATLVGVLIALVVIYWLSPLNNGGVALVVLLSVSFANIVVGAIAALRKRPARPGPSPRKKRGNHPKLLVLALLLAGCSAPEQAPPPPAAQEPSQPPKATYHHRGHKATTGQQAENLPARDFLLRNQSPPAGYGAYGYLVFTARPDASSLPLYQAACENYESSLQTVDQYSDVPPSHLMVTFWLLQNRPAEASCDALIKSYDLAAATKIARRIGKLNVRGPILVAWRSPFDFGSTDAGDSLVVDMSSFSSPSDVSEAFRVWRDKISQDPEVWSHGFNLAIVRVALRSFLNTYGQQVVALVGGGGSH